MIPDQTRRGWCCCCCCYRVSDYVASVQLIRGDPASPWRKPRKPAARSRNSGSGSGILNVNYTTKFTEKYESRESERERERVNLDGERGKEAERWKLACRKLTRQLKEREPSSSRSLPLDWTFMAASCKLRRLQTLISIYRLVSPQSARLVFAEPRRRRLEQSPRTFSLFFFFDLKSSSFANLSLFPTWNQFHNSPSISQL